MFVSFSSSQVRGQAFVKFGERTQEARELEAKKHRIDAMDATETVQTLIQESTVAHPAMAIVKRAEDRLISFILPSDSSFSDRPARATRGQKIRARKILKAIVRHPEFTPSMRLVRSLEETMGITEYVSREEDPPRRISEMKAMYRVNRYRAEDRYREIAELLKKEYLGRHRQNVILYTEDVLTRAIRKDTEGGPTIVGILEEVFNQKRPGFRLGGILKTTMADARDRAAHHDEIVAYDNRRTEKLMHQGAFSLSALGVHSSWLEGLFN